jgi:phage baseplate assembly protein W
MANQIKGIAVNFRFGNLGFPEPAVNVESLSDSIYTILSTFPGERVHRPQFGCNLKRLLFTNVTPASIVRARVEARRAIERWEPRVIVDSLEVQRDQRSASKILLEVIWRPKGSLSDARRTQIPLDIAGAR